MEKTLTNGDGVSPNPLGTAQTYTLPERNFCGTPELRNQPGERMTWELSLLCYMCLHFRCWMVSVNYTSLITCRHQSCTRIKPPAQLSTWGEERSGMVHRSQQCGQSWGQSRSQPARPQQHGDTSCRAALSGGRLGEREWGKTNRKQPWEAPQLPDGCGKAPSAPPYLISAGDAQPVEDRQEYLSTAQHHQGVGDGEDAEDGTVAVDLGRGAQHSDSWHEAGGEWESHGDGSHASAPHEKVLGGLLSPSRKGVVDADDSRHQQHGGEDHIVPNAEAPHATGAIHPCSPTQNQMCSCGRKATGPRQPRLQRGAVRGAALRPVSAVPGRRDGLIEPRRPLLPAAPPSAKGRWPGQCVPLRDGGLLPHNGVGRRGGALPAGGCPLPCLDPRTPCAWWKAAPRSAPGGGVFYCAVSIPSSEDDGNAFLYTCAF